MAIDAKHFVKYEKEQQRLDNLETEKIKKLKAELAKTKKSLERMKNHYRSCHADVVQKDARIEVLIESNARISKDREIFREDLVKELKFQLSCKGTEYYTPTNITQRIMNTISKAQPFNVILQ